MNNDDFMQYASFYYLCVLRVANLRATFEALFFCSITHGKVVKKNREHQLVFSVLLYHLTMRYRTEEQSLKSGPQIRHP